MITIFVMLGRCGKGGGLAAGWKAETLSVQAPDRSKQSYEQAREQAIADYAKLQSLPINQVHHYGSWCSWNGEQDQLLPRPHKHTIMYGAWHFTHGRRKPPIA